MLRLSAFAALLLLLLGGSAALWAWTHYSGEYEIFWIGNTQRVRVERDGLTLRGEIRLHEDPRVPLIVFLHPCQRVGRRTRVNWMLFNGLSREFSVATFDLRGFGESDGLPRVDRVEQLDFVGDLRAWLDLYRDEYGFDRDRVVLVGHSTGGGAIIHYLAEYPDEPLRAALIVPIYPEKLRETLDAEVPPIEKRWEKDMHSTRKIDSGVVKSLIPQMSFAALPAAQHGRAVLIIDTPGAYVEAFPRAIYEQLSEPRRLYQARQGDHYLGARTPVQRWAARYLRRVALVHRELMLPVIDEIAALARRESPERRREARLPGS